LDRIHDGKVGNEPLLTPQDETFSILCFENYYQQWEKDFQIEADHPKKSSLRPTKKTSFHPLIPACRNGGRDHQIWSWLGDKIHQLQGGFSIVQWMDHCRQGTVQEIVKIHHPWSQQTHYSCQRGAGHYYQVRLKNGVQKPVMQNTSKPRREHEWVNNFGQNFLVG
jgi:hypothetical protein